VIARRGDELEARLVVLSSPRVCAVGRLGLPCVVGERRLWRVQDGARPSPPAVNSSRGPCLVVRGAPSADRRPRPGSGRARPCRGRAQLSRVCWCAWPVGVCAAAAAAGCGRLAGGPAASWPLSELPGDARAVAERGAAASGGPGQGDRLGTAGQGGWAWAPAGCGGAGRAGDHGAGLAAPVRRPGGADPGAVHAAGL
jgi:hypothetical protein